MPTNARAFLKPFMGGMNTEQPQTDDAVQFTMDELNCTILPEAIRGRRYGMNIERNGSWLEADDSTIYSGFYWMNVGKTSEDFIVHQSGPILRIFEAIRPFSQHEIKTARVDLTQYITDSNNFNQFPVKYAIGDGKLVVTNKYMKPVQIEYDFDNQDCLVKEVKIEYRDREGVEDGLAIDKLPTTLSDDHKYNLMNQGWSVEDINKFYENKKSYPSNNLQWFLGKDNSGIFNTEELLKKYFGNTPAPKGHYILDYFDRRRDYASGIYKGTARTATYVCNQCYGKSGGQVKGTVINNFSVVIPNSSGTATTIDLNFTTLQSKIGKTTIGNWAGSCRFKLFGLKDNNWTMLHEEVHKFFKPERVHFEYTNAVKYDQYKVEGHFFDNVNGMPDVPGPFNIVCYISLPIAEDGNPFPFSHGLDRVTDIAYMSGKYFYLTGDTVLFSQTITENNKGFGKCYQDADPTSEEISDIVPTDGGLVKFHTMGEGLALKTFNRGVLVFGKDSVWGLISPLESKFTATEYDILSLSKAGLIGAESVVSTTDAVFYWSPQGIFRIGISAQTGNTIVAESISENTIQKYYQSIPSWSRKHCKGVYDYTNNRIYWFYPTDSNNTTKLDAALVFDLNYGAFYPFKISDGGSITAVFETMDSFEITPLSYLRAGGKRVVVSDLYEGMYTTDLRNVIAVEQNRKYSRYSSIMFCVKRDDNRISFGDFNSREFVDWELSPYESYLLSRPITMNDTYSNKQVPVLQTLFKRTEEERLRTGRYIAESGAYLRMRWGWSLSDKSNRWDLIQNAYRPQKDFEHDEFVESRLHVRGRGKAFQIEIRNDKNKDFKLSGINLIIRGR